MSLSRDIKLCRNYTKIQIYTSLYRSSRFVILLHKIRVRGAPRTQSRIVVTFSLSLVHYEQGTSVYNDKFLACSIYNNTLYSILCSSSPGRSFFLADYWFPKKSNILYTLSCNFLANKNKEHLSDTPILITHANIYNLRVTPRVPSTNHFLNWVAARKGRIWLSGGGFLGKLCLKFFLYKSTHLNYRIILIESRKLNWLHQSKNLRQIDLGIH